MDRNSLIKSQALRKIIHTSDSELVNRYVKKCVTPQNIQKELERVLSLANEDGNAKYGAINAFNNDLPDGKYGSATTNYIFDKVFMVINPVLVKAGYQLNVENIVKDLDDVFNDYALQVLAAHNDPSKVPNFVKEIVSVFYTNVLTDKVLSKVLGNNISNLV